MNIRNNEYKEAESMNSVLKVLSFVGQPCKYTTAQLHIMGLSTRLFTCMKRNRVGTVYTFPLNSTFSSVLASVLETRTRIGNQD